MKYEAADSFQPALGVAPFTGAWIEIMPLKCALNYAIRRTLHGCVD